MSRTGASLSCDRRTLRVSLSSNRINRRKSWNRSRPIVARNIGKPRNRLKNSLKQRLLERSTPATISKPMYARISHWSMSFQLCGLCFLASRFVYRTIIASKASSKIRRKQSIAVSNRLPGGRITFDTIERLRKRSGAWSSGWSFHSVPSRAIKTLLLECAVLVLPTDPFSLSDSLPLAWSSDSNVASSSLSWIYRQLLHRCTRRPILCSLDSCLIELRWRAPRWLVGRQMCATNYVDSSRKRRKGTKNGGKARKNGEKRRKNREKTAKNHTNSTKYV